MTACRHGCHKNANKELKKSRMEDNGIIIVAPSLDSSKNVSGVSAVARFHHLK